MYVKLITCACVLLLLLSCNAETESNDGVREIKADGKISSIIRNPVSAMPSDTTDAAVLTFDEQEYDFGEIDEGGVVNHTFTYTNTGKKPLIVTHVRSTCGCTIPEWSKEPTPPGGKGEIYVKFDTEGKRDYQSKPVTVTANTFPAQSVVTLKGRVINKE